MSKKLLSKISTILIGLSLVAVSAYPAFAQQILGRPDVAASNPGSLRKPPVLNKQNPVMPVKTVNVENRIESIKEKIASREAALKVKLQTFKDKKKAAIAERIDTLLNKINLERVIQMQKNLALMSSILDKLEARVNKPAPDIKAPEATRTAIAAARTMIASTSAAVSAQSLKDYTIVVTSESRIRVDVKTQRDKLFADLSTLRKMMVDTKQAVVNAIRIAKSGALTPAVAPVKEGTTSGEQ